MMIDFFGRLQPHLNSIKNHIAANKDASNSKLSPNKPSQIRKIAIVDNIPIKRRSPRPVSIGKNPFRSTFGLYTFSTPKNVIDPNIAMKNSALCQVQYIHPKVSTNQLIIFIPFLMRSLLPCSFVRNRQPKRQAQWSILRQPPASPT